MSVSVSCWKELLDLQQIRNNELLDLLQVQIIKDHVVEEVGEQKIGKEVVGWEVLGE